MKRMGAAAVLAAALLLSGCGKAALPYAREMGDMALLRTMGVDAEEEAGQVRVTVSTGKRAAGLQGESQPPLILSAGGESLSAACLSMQGLSDSYVFYGYVDQLLLGEEAALEGVEPVLDYFSRDVELGLGAQVWLVRGGTAQAAIEAGGETGVDSRLSTLQTDSEMGAAGITRTAGEVFSSLLEQGCAYLPALRAAGPEETEGQTVLLEAGYGVLRDGKLAGYLDGESAKGLELLTGQTAEDIIEVDLPSGRAVARITEVSTRCEPVFQGEELTGLRLYCRAAAELAEFHEPMDQGELAQLREALEEREGLRLRQVMEQLRGWGTDCTALGSQVAQADPARWEKLRGEWEERFSTIPYEVSVQVSVSRTYGELKE